MRLVGVPEIKQCESAYETSQFTNIIAFCIMYYRLKYILEQHNILHDSQYGFHKKRSAEHSLLDIINQIETNMGEELYSRWIFIDLRKAFDKVDRRILLSKLHHYGVQGIINDWFSSYLLSCQQTNQPLLLIDKTLTLDGIAQEVIRQRATNEECRTYSRGLGKPCERCDI